MQQLAPEGHQLVGDLAGRYGYSEDAVTHMLIAVLNGNGSMAQFSHPEFGGSGQWMQGGMTMVGDMFNMGLKGSVDSLCTEISNVLATQPGLMQSGSFQSQSQNGSSQQHQATGGSFGQSSLFVPDPEQNWWPQEFGPPSSLGSQNSVRYAYFSGARRLAVRTNQDIYLYDTLDHQIGGFSQQQGGGSSITFTSQYGTVNLSTLPVVSINGQVVPLPASTPPPAAAGEASCDDAISGEQVAIEDVSVEDDSSKTVDGVPTAPPVAPQSATPVPAVDGEALDIIEAITRLGELRDNGWLTEEEFSSKKTELLSRL